MIETDPTLHVASFYDALSPDYDLMTGFQARLASEEPVFRDLVTRYDIRSALDAGAGTGLHSLILSRLGVRVTAVDISGSMLRRLENNAEDLGVAVRTLESSLEELSPKEAGTVDAVFCLGNTISHAGGEDDLRRILGNFSRIVRPGGMLFIQLLNYARVLRNAQRMQNVRERQGTIFIRYYDFEPGFIRFNTLTLRSNQEFSLQSVNLHPFVREDFLHTLPDSGFAEVKVFGDLSGKEFNPGESTDLVIHAVRNGKVMMDGPEV